MMKPFNKPIISLELVTKLIAAQFPQWAALLISAVEFSGWDNKMFRLGDELSIRLPSDEAYVAQVQKEQDWLPILAPQLELPIPEPVAMGKPSDIYPWPWSIYRWTQYNLHLEEMLAILEEKLEKML